MCFLIVFNLLWNDDDDDDNNKVDDDDNNNNNHINDLNHYFSPGFPRFSGLVVP